MRYASLTLCLALATAGVLRADTIVMKTGQKLDGKIVSSNGETVEIEVEYGTMRVPQALILSVEQQSPEQIAAREEEKAQEKEHAAMMRAEGKVLYKGKWIDAEEKEEIEAKQAAEKKKKDEEKAAAKKKKDEELAKKKEEERKRLEEEQRRREQIAQQNGGRYDPRAERFNRSRGKDDNGNTINNTNTTSTNSTNRGRTQNDYSRSRTR